MALPSKSEQIAAVMRFLDSDRNEGRDLKDIAKEIVEGYHDAILKGIKKPATPLRPGMLFRLPIDGKVRRVAWMEDGWSWIVSESDAYGSLAPESVAFWSQAEEFQPSGFKTVDGKRKSVPKTAEEIEAEWSNPDWKVGDRASIGQRQVIFEVIATAPKSVLMRNVATGVLNSDSSSNLDRFYRREIEMGKIEW